MNKFSKTFRRILNSDLFTLLGILLVWRIFITAAGIIGLIMFAPLDMPAMGSYGTFWDMWTRWDGWHYINISNNGYANPQLTAFFPLYPMLIHGLSTLLHLNPAIAGLLISHFALLGALYFIFRMIKDIYSRSIAYTSILLLLFFPTALFFSVVYTESLFLFLATGAIFFARNGKWWISALFAFFTAATRNIGVLIILPLAFEYYNQYGWRLKKSILALLAPVLSLGLYAIYLLRVFGDPLQFITAQSAWNRSIELNPFAILWDKFLRIGSSIQNQEVFPIIEIFAGLSLLIIIVLSFQKKYKMPKSLVVYMIAMLFPAFSQNTWASMNRYVSVIFPAFVLLALIVEKKPLIQNILIAGISIFLGVTTILFVNFRWAG